MEDKTLLTFDSVTEWNLEAKERGLDVRKIKDEDNEDISELFAEADDTNITMVGYFSEGWGMLS